MAGCLVADLTESEWRNCNHPATIGRVVAISVHRATRLQFPCPGLHSCDTNQRMAAGVCASDAQSLDLSPEAASSRATLTCLGYAQATERVPSRQPPGWWIVRVGHVPCPVRSLSGRVRVSPLPVQEGGAWRAKGAWRHSRSRRATYPYSRFVSLTKP